MFHLIPTNLEIDFLKISRPFVIVSTLFVLLSLVLLVKPGLNYGIDFTGGAEVHIRVPNDWKIDRVREELSKGGINDPTVVQIGEEAQSEFLVKIQALPNEIKSVSEQVEKALAAQLQAGQYEIKRADVVGPQAGSKLKQSAILSLFYAGLGIVIYIALRFDFRFAPGILRALLFDMVSTLGIWVLMGREFNLTTLASILTIAGYSCNDTIVIYDRIRDYSKTNSNWPIEKIVNKSINLNLGRTVLTVICTLFVVVSIWLLGGPVLSDFALCMLIGFVISVFSTIFVANSLVVFMEKRRLARIESIGRRRLAT
ncbi:MAG: protein translocase subunit SecF [Oligoflexia bacterium]|nr:protein translocase subunit SecF [Oligoflexia bacterium]